MDCAKLGYPNRHIFRDARPMTTLDDMTLSEL